MISRRGFDFSHKEKSSFSFEILRFALYDKYNRGFGGKALDDSSHLIIRVFLFRFCFFFFHRNKKEKVNISLSVGLAKPTYVFQIYISLFNQALSPTPSPKGEGNCCICVDLPLILTPNLSQNNSLNCFARQSPRRGELLYLLRLTPHPNLPTEGKEHNFFTGKKQPLKIKTAFIIY